MCKNTGFDLCRVETIMKFMNHQKQLAIQVSWLVVYISYRLISVCVYADDIFMTTRIVSFVVQ